jgi:hypothetical protein
MSDPINPQRARQEQARVEVEESTRQAAARVHAFYARQAATPPQRPGEAVASRPRLAIV